MGRVNRAISGYPDLEAVCITVKYPILEDFFNIAQNSEFGLCRETIYVNEILDWHNIKALERSEEKLRELIDGKEDKVVEVNYIEISHDAENPNQYNQIKHDYGSPLAQNPDEIEIRSCWGSLLDILYGNSDASKRISPPMSAGVYIARNVKTSEVLYVGSSSCLRNRLCPKSRWYKDERWWVEIEGIQNIFLTWYETDNFLDTEDELKDILKPKYDQEKRRTKSYEKWEKLWSHRRKMKEKIS